MASLLRARAARPEWTVEESAIYAARRDFELLKMLSTDKKALRVARILGLPFLSHATPKTQVDGAKTVPKDGSVRAQAQPEQGKSNQQQQRLSQKKRKLRQASASKLQALVVGFLTRPQRHVRLPFAGLGRRLPHVLLHFARIRSMLRPGPWKLEPCNSHGRCSARY